jgi:hypothetical protein
MNQVINNGNGNMQWILSACVVQRRITLMMHFDIAYHFQLPTKLHGTLAHSHSHVTSTLYKRHQNPTSLHLNYCLHGGRLVQISVHHPTRRVRNR